MSLPGEKPGGASLIPALASANDQSRHSDKATYTSGGFNFCQHDGDLARVACNAANRGPCVCYWHAELGADGKDYIVPSPCTPPFRKFSEVECPKGSRSATQGSAVRVSSQGLVPFRRPLTIEGEAS